MGQSVTLGMSALDGVEQLTWLAKQYLTSIDLP
jgi:hypothetical protein